MRTIAVPIESLVVDPTQPRRSMSPDEFYALVESIRVRGLLLPLRVRSTGDGRCMIVSGHRRLAALRTLGVREAPCVVVDGEPEEAVVLAEQLAENLLRDSLSAIDEALAYERYLGLRRITAAQAAEELAVLPARISRALSLLTLPDSVREAVQAGTIPKETAYHLSRLPEGELRDRLLAKALAGILTRDEAAGAAKARREPSPTRSVQRVVCRLAAGRTLTISGAGMTLDSVIVALEETLRQSRKARGQGWDVTTLTRVLRDRAGGGA